MADQANRAWLHSQQLQSEAKAGQQNADALQEQENALKVSMLARGLLAGGLFCSQQSGL